MTGNRPLSADEDDGARLSAYRHFDCHRRQTPKSPSPRDRRRSRGAAGPTIGAARDGLWSRRITGAHHASIAVIISALANIVAGRQLADTFAAFLIAPRSFSPLREAIDVLLEATPRDVNVDTLREHVLSCSGVLDIHDLHVWSITSGVNVIAAHVVVHAGANPSVVLDDLETCLRGDFDIEHSTFQLETEDRKRIESGRIRERGSARSARSR